MSNLDKSTGCRCSLYRAHSNTHDVVARLQFLLLSGNDYPSGSEGKLQIGAGIAMRQARVMFVQGKIFGSGRIGRGGFFRIEKSKFAGIRRSLEVLGIAIESIGMIDQAIRLSNLSNDRLVLGGLGCLIHSFFPLLETLLPCFDLLDKFFIGRVNGLLGFDPGDLQFRSLILPDRSFQLHPVDPDGRRETITILSL